jgi:hypothetical protein
VSGPFRHRRLFGQFSVGMVTGIVVGFERILARAKRVWRKRWLLQIEIVLGVLLMPYSPLHLP